MALLLELYVIVLQTPSLLSAAINTIWGVMQLEQSEVLKPKVKIRKKNFYLEVEYNPRLSNISVIIKKHIHLLESNRLVKDIIPAKFIIRAYCRTENLKDTLAPPKFKRKQGNEPV